MVSLYLGNRISIESPNEFYKSCLTRNAQSGILKSQDVYEQNI